MSPNNWCNQLPSSSMVRQTRIWLSRLALLVWNWQYRKWDEFAGTAFSWPLGIKIEAYRDSPNQLLSSYKFGGISIVTECPRRIWWLNLLGVLLVGKQELYKVDGWKYYKIDTKQKLKLFDYSEFMWEVCWCYVERVYKWEQRVDFQVKILFLEYNTIVYKMSCHAKS